MKKKENVIFVIGITVAILFLPAVYILERIPLPCSPKSDNLSRMVVVFYGDINKPILEKYGVREYEISSSNSSKIKVTMPVSCMDDLEKETLVKRTEGFVEDEMPGSF